ncbi:MAG: hypothetical protein AB7G75_29970 [Candidatus Binatia bacterium]
MNISRAREDCWPIDGTHHHDVDPAAIYQDKHIKEFFANNTKTLLVACKGMGKTLLLRSKKKTLEEEGAEGVLIIPRNREYDEPRLRGSYNPKGMSGLLFWEELWNAAIVFSILTHGQKSEDNEAKKASLLHNSISRLAIDASFKHELLEEIREKKELLPSDYLAKLLECGVGSLKKFTKSSHNVDALSIHFIKSAVCVFIDAFDQTLTDCFPNALDVWRDAQLGLARTVHKINTKNKHIKVYATIRQEAWSGFENQDREVITGRAFLIEYSERALQELFLHAVKRYSNKNTIEEFFGLPTIHNSTCFTNEAPFSYLYRHAVGSARSIIGLGAQLDQEDLLILPNAEREQHTKQLINRAASENVFKDYVLGQRKIFLEALQDEGRLRKLFSLLPSNVLTGKSLKTIHQRFCEQMAIAPDESHPFGELFNVGLLGEVKRSDVGPELVQCFRRPFEFQWKQGAMLKDEATYLIHPSLIKVINEERQSFFVNPINPVGSNRPWLIPEGRSNAIPRLFITQS